MIALNLESFEGREGSIWAAVGAGRDFVQKFSSVPVSDLVLVFMIEDDDTSPPRFYVPEANTILYIDTHRLTCLSHPRYNQEE